MKKLLSILVVVLMALLASSCIIEEYYTECPTESVEPEIVVIEPIAIVELISSGVFGPIVNDIGEYKHVYAIENTSTVVVDYRVRVDAWCQYQHPANPIWQTELYRIWDEGVELFPGETRSEEASIGFFQYPDVPYDWYWNLIVGYTLTTEDGTEYYFPVHQY